MSLVGSRDVTLNVVRKGSMMLAVVVVVSMVSVVMSCVMSVVAGHGDDERSC